MSNSIESTLVETRVFPPPESFVKQANVSGRAAYQALLTQADDDPDAFWGQMAREHLHWTRPFTQVLDESNAPFYRWFGDGELNVSANCLEANIERGLGGKEALIFEADNGDVTRVTYQALYEKVCQIANGFKQMGYQAGDRVIIYLPMSVEAVAVMQACARLGLIHSVVFGGFSSKALQERIIDVGATLVVTADEQVRGGKNLPLKTAVDEAIAMGGCEAVKHVVVYKRTGGNVAWHEKRDIWLQDLMQDQATSCAPVAVNAEHPLFILYTSGSTGKPKGVQHASGGYLLWAKLTMQWTFDAKPDDVFWCTADVGWVTGHTYITYGPLAAGMTQIVFEGVPTYPNAGRFWQMIERHKATVFYTAPTAIRSLIKAAETNEQFHPKSFDLTSLRLLGSVGEPINPEAWM